MSEPRPGGRRDRVTDLGQRQFSAAAAAVLSERYLRRDEHGRIVESPEEMFDRVATFVAGVEDGFQPGSSTQWAPQFSSLLRSLEFLPNSPTLMNAGTRLGVLSGCFVLPLEDSLPSIFRTLGQTALLHQAGAGTGYTFGHLRPAGDLVASTGGTASGPLSFLRLFDTAADVIQQGGRRRGASIAVLDVSHPDVFDFAAAKEATTGDLRHFNLSVAVTDAFLRAVTHNRTHRLVNPRTERTVAEVPAADLFDTICTAAHRSGDPGLLFLDTVNRANPLRERIEATNPCGEVPLLPYESCNLGSVNLALLTRDGEVDWDRLAEVVRLAVRFLDDVIDVSRYPFPELADAAQATRKIGLGVMGLADLLADLGIPYDSEPGVRLAGRIAQHIQHIAHAESAALAVTRGRYPRAADSRFASTRHLRNAQVTSVAPTGTLSLIAGTSSGIEPLFALAYERRVLGRRVLEINRGFERLARERGCYSDELIADIAHRGGVRGNRHVPEDLRAAFPTALEIAPEWHLRVQAAVQRHVDAAVSKTVNLPESATATDIRDLYLTAWRYSLKGITVYRYGSKEDQALSFATHEPGLSRTDIGSTGGCAGCACEF
ncbi:adenosylcobalamin-dependent ribonucleoside-diphosphate reductase [Rhodococcus opacus]|uniref:adenosylcobalamin-dependent ribonucleoside-diphosphate reductase n=1 Tax=Rhodococcus opacus TaxID=37919 RepID=UPI002948E8D5|nr:adenosylcobalamin-dependent ribonucleoside-diphosphate reductase [Rhodococcus opacus]MDV6241942.1 adenosylcobalamin-dependent ribonucleoside-diphosphate reductase [Rhodococcus opacus]